MMDKAAFFASLYAESDHEEDAAGAKLSNSGWAASALQVPRRPHIRPGCGDDHYSTPESASSQRNRITHTQRVSSLHVREEIDWTRDERPAKIQRTSKVEGSDLLRGERAVASTTFGDKNNATHKTTCEEKSERSWKDELTSAVVDAPLPSEPGSKLKKNHLQSATVNNTTSKQQSSRRKEPDPPPFYCMDNSHLPKARRSRQTLPPTPIDGASDLTRIVEQPAPAQKPSQIEAVQSKKRDRQHGKGSTSKKTLERPEPIARGKKRKEFPLKELPEHKKIFREWVIYYFPNSDVSPARKFRMRKAAERGALRAENWSASVTHLVGDNDRTYRDVLDHLEVDSLPKNIVIVNDYYPAECIEFGWVIDPSQRRFRLKGEPNRGITLTNTLAPLRPGKLSKRDAVARTPPRSPDKDEEPSPLEDGAYHNQPITRPSPVEEAADVSVSARQGYAVSEIIPETEQRVSSNLLSEAAMAGPCGKQKISTGGPRDQSNTCDRVDPDPLIPRWQQGFQCMHSHTRDSSELPPNHRVAELLAELSDYCERNGDQWRAMSYRRGSAALRKWPTKVTTKAEALAIPTIGESLADKIVEVAETDDLRRLQHAKEDPVDKTLQLFTHIYGVGTKQAHDWIAQGLRTLEDLRNRAALTRNQRIGLDHYVDFTTRIPREEIALHETFVKQAVSRLDNHVEVVVGGSYRRGSPNSGDIDFLIIGKESMSTDALRTLVIDKLIPHLFEAKYLQCALAASTDSRKAASKWHGAATMPSLQEKLWRRVDFLIVPGAERGAAVLYFTGSALFNRSMRLLARKRGMRLNQRGLWGRPHGTLQAQRPKSASGVLSDEEVNIADGELVESRHERRIFDILGIPWREPRERNC